ncbi:uncharacterized protein N7525_005503 [Penicillium rubens]|uniref:uncharacterized protein n=1 Tax=Penicillium rubens TaxID=1108849 RepID=UPI002A5ADC7C|nr:uncharacterized protein N7525_005503 [Penicillium rubens]KAJ5840315.1 hypothetical protein N7525_005503 [Penicillium rubens]
MYVCRLCNKNYQSRGSLTRHVRNHSVDSSQHVCPTCGVAFSRRDLLRRHVQIHRPEDPPVSPSTGVKLHNSAPRRRCHTACQPCRMARIKCTGEQPCTQCISSQAECWFEARAHRVSRIVEVDPTQDQARDLNLEDSRVEDGASPKTNREPAMPPVSDMLQSPVSNSNSPNISFLPSDHSMSQQDQASEMSQMPEIDFSWAGTFPCNTASWPWLHESLFLQGNPMLNWPDSFGASPLNQMDEAAVGLTLVPDESAQPTVSDIALPTEPISFDTPATPSNRIDIRVSEHGKEYETSQPELPDSLDLKAEKAWQESIVHELVTYTSGQNITPGSQMARSLYWQSISIRIAEAFNFGSWRSGEPKLSLFRMMEMYRENFSPLWPLLSGKDFDPDHLNPMLFLTVVSIGCMYGCDRECKFGNMLHEEIRRHLAGSLIGLEDGEGDILWLGQARLLTQVAALYFGQRRAFSYAQHLGAIIAAQARRMGLFSTCGSIISADSSLEQQVAAWHNSESRKRLAFGILRADVFTSVLLNTRPLLSAEEVCLDFPTNDEIWEGLDEAPADELVARLKAEAPKTLALPFCDLVRVATDRGETILSMNARGYELLIFGLQDQVWRFSHDRSLFTRLIGKSDGALTQNQSTPESISGSFSIPSSSQSDQLGLTYRQMHDLRDDRIRITQTLQRWEQSFTATRTTQTFAKDRSSVMSSMLLLHISHLRLSAPLADLHTAVYNLIDKSSLDQTKLQALYQWTSSPEAIQAVNHICQIWLLLHNESHRDGSEKAKYNLLAFSGLHHAAVVIWVIAGANSEQTDDAPELPGSYNMAPIPIRRSHNQLLLKTVIGLYQRLIPRGWSSFAAAAEYMAAHPFPTCP